MWYCFNFYFLLLWIQHVVFFVNIEKWFNIIVGGNYCVIINAITLIIAVDAKQ